jgi:cytochrome P450
MGSNPDLEDGDPDADAPAGGGDRTGGAAVGSPEATAPLPPYPSNTARPALHWYHLMFRPIEFIEEAVAERDVGRVRVPGQGCYFGLGHPEHMKRVLLTDREKFHKSEDFRIAFGEGLLTVEGEEWRKQRDVLQPLFTRDSVIDYADGMVSQMRRRIDRWEDGQRFDLQGELTHMTLDVLFATVLGRELDVDGDERLRQAAERLHDWFIPTSYLFPNWVPTPARRRFHKAKRAIEDEADRLLTEAAGEAPTDPSDADDLLSLLVGLRESGMADSAMLTDERLRDQMVTMIFAGHDTTTTALTFSFWGLANNEGVRERFHEEVDALDGPPTMADLDSLPVTERVVTESLRLFPPVYILPRETTEPFHVEGYRIPAGERINVLIREIQRDERFFEDPDTFRPSRWTDDERDRHDFAYAPFGGGPRICIGRQFALLEAKLALATIGREYDLAWLGENDADGEPPVSAEMTLRMAPGQEFRAVER